MQRSTLTRNEFKKKATFVKYTEFTVSHTIFKQIFFILKNQTNKFITK